jgi:hypothetical protein
MRDSMARLGHSSCLMERAPRVTPEGQATIAFDATSEE